MNIAKEIEDRARYCCVEERRPVGIHCDNLGPVPLRHRHQTTSEIIRRLRLTRRGPALREGYFGPLVPVYESLERRYG